jgi:S-layer homology domain
MNSRLRFLALGLAIAGPLSAQSAGPLAPRTYGTAAVSYLSVPAVEFLPVDSASGYGNSGIYGYPYSRYAASCTGLCLAAPLHLPSGARIVSVDLNAYDVEFGSWVSGTLTVCDSLQGACFDHPAVGTGDADCLTAGQICSGSFYDFGPISVSADLTADAITVDNADNVYLLRAGGNYAAFPAVTSLLGMRVGYVLQVSPAPVTSDFGDVPTSSPQYQFIEALYASGITAGCGSGNYCPNAPLTRGQMAVFLAKALGLQWP